MEAQGLPRFQGLNDREQYGLPMKNRRSFLAAVASGSVGLSLVSPVPAAAQSPATPSPAPSPSGKHASFGSAAMAATMRSRFDPALTDADLQTIAKAIDANNDAAKQLNPKKKPLKNGDAPAVRFAVLGGEL
jgi:hypothetical protein